MTRRKILSFLAAGSLLMLSGCSVPDASVSSAVPSEAASEAVATEAPTAEPTEEATEALEPEDAAGVEPNVLEPEANVSGRETYTALNGKVESVNISMVGDKATIVAKYAMPDTSVDAVMDNTLDLIQNQDGALFGEIQVWAVDGSGDKFISFTLDQPDIQSVADGSAQIRSVATDWWNM